MEGWEGAYEGNTLKMRGTKGIKGRHREYREGMEG